MRYIISILMLIAIKTIIIVNIYYDYQILNKLYKKQ